MCNNDFVHHSRFPNQVLQWDDKSRSFSSPCHGGWFYASPPPPVASSHKLVCRETTCRHNSKPFQGHRLW
jgi:hypothetical protein